MVRKERFRYWNSNKSYCWCGDGTARIPGRAKEKQRNAHRGRKMSEFTKEQLRIANLNKPSQRKGATLSDDTKANISAAKKGKALSNAHKEK